MIKAIFFDFNGVIIDDEQLQLQAYREILLEHSIDLTEADYYAALGMDDKTFVRTAFAKASRDLPEATLQSILEEKGVKHRKLIEDDLPLFPGVVTFVKSVARGYSVGLVSMATLDEASYVLHRSGLHKLFSVVVTAEEVSACKPDPECYVDAFNKLNELRQIERRLPLLPDECLAIEDSPPGILAARGAGMRTLGVTNTVSEEQLRAAGADVVTPSLFDWTADAVGHVFD